MLSTVTMTDDLWTAATGNLPTPALIVDLDRVQRNITRLAEYARSHALNVRPHTKTHKSKQMAQLQIAAGAKGLTAAKVGEAIQFAEIENDILIAYPAFDPIRAPRLVQLARDHLIHVAVDSVEAIDHLAAFARAAGTVVGILVDLDVGLHRTGVSTPEKTRELARRAASTSGARLDGLFCYPGHIWGTPESQPERLRQVGSLLIETIDLWKRDGLAAPIVSGGSTPTAYQSHHCAGLTEIRPGTYIFNDRNTVDGGYCSWDDCAARVLCTVVSTAVEGQVVIDAGAKTLAADRCIPNLESGHGFLPDFPAARVTALSEEHGQVDVSRCERRPRLGDRVVVIPNHICPCVNLHDGFWSLREGQDPERCEVDARGLLV
jgi:D-serine deaminase-like pyridoxal phosphate-dependent protein